MREVRTLECIAAEGAFVCNELRAGHVNASYASMHFDELLQDALKSRNELAKPAATMLDAQHARASELAERLVDRLQSMVSLRLPEGELQEQQQAMLRLKGQFDSLEQAL